MATPSESLNYIDISPLLSPQIGVFPGDTPFKHTEHLNFSSGDNLKLSSIETSLHLGAHTDAPNHYHQDGRGIDQVNLAYYFGKAQVIEVNLKPNQRVRPQDIEGKAIRAPRVLFKTNSFPNPNQWNSDFNSLSPELVQELDDKGVCLVGIDTPSVDPEKDETLLSHNAIYQAEMAILEGIVLTDVKEGIYQLVAFPLKIKDADASPVRALLFPEDTHASF